jgi:hypothetical protein
VTACLPFVPNSGNRSTTGTSTVSERSEMSANIVARDHHLGTRHGRKPGAVISRAEALEGDQLAVDRQGQLAGGCSALVDLALGRRHQLHKGARPQSAHNCRPADAQYSSRSSRLYSLPVAVLGSAWRKSTERGTL